MAGKLKKKSRKHDRNRKWCEAYRNSGTREINKAKKLARHMRRFPWDAKALNCLKGLSALTLKRAGVTVPELRPSPKDVRDMTLTAMKRQQKQAA